MPPISSHNSQSYEIISNLMKIVCKEEKNYCTLTIDVLSVEFMAIIYTIFLSSLCLEQLLQNFGIDLLSHTPNL
jgi:hypothetical protein